MARSRRQWGSVRSLASGRYQARYFDPDARRMVPAPQTFATKGGADRWLAAKRTELDAGSAVDEKGRQPAAARMVARLLAINPEPQAPHSHRL